MNFKKLQAMQAKLDDAILAEKATMAAEERFEKTLAALSVEIAEVANTAEHFKFWKDNKGKVDRGRFCRIPQTVREGETVVPEYVDLALKHGSILSFEQAHKLTLVEEASDCLHFVLSLANQFQMELTSIKLPDRKQFGIPTLEAQYLAVQDSLTGSYFELNAGLMEHVLLPNLFEYFHALGVTDEELEQAYYEKNKVNYERLENGY